MNLTEIKNEKAIIIEIEGRLDTTNYNQLEQKILEQIEANQKNILVDCTKMDYVSSSGLRIFLMALKKITALKGKFVLCGLQENIAEIFEISGFTSIFHIYENREKAMLVF